MKKVFIVLAVCTMFGCKNEKADQIEQTASEANAKTDFFKITLDAVVRKDENFHLFYTEDGTLNFTEDKSAWAGIKGSESSQKIVFNLPEDKLPTTLRIDFGLNEDQGEIKINKMEMSYYGKTATISGAEFFKYFRPNEANTVVDVANQTIKGIPQPNRKPGEAFSGPSVYPMEPLEKEISRITK